MTKGYRVWYVAQGGTVDGAEPQPFFFSSFLQQSRPTARLRLRPTLLPRTSHKVTVVQCIISFAFLRQIPCRGCIARICVVPGYL